MALDPKEQILFQSINTLGVVMACLFGIFFFGRGGGGAVFMTHITMQEAFESDYSLFNKY